MDEAKYLIEVRRVLDELGSNNSDADVTGSGDYWKHCRNAGIEAKVCAATIYSGVRHRHEVSRTVIKENTVAASEAPVREEWEVVVKRAGVSPDDITSAAGRRPDEVTAGNAVFAGFNDDEKAASFSKKMTKAGYISSFGPRRDYTLHEEAREQHAISKRQEIGALLHHWYGDAPTLRHNDPMYAVGSYYLNDKPYPRKEMVEAARFDANRIARRLSSNSPEKRELRKIVRGLDHYALVDYPYGPQATAEENREWTKVIFDSPVAAQVFREEIERDSSYEANLLGKNVFTTAPYDVIMRAFKKTGVHGSVHREAEEVAAEAPAATTEVAAECASCIPWQKVSRDANVAASNAELAKKYGAIKNAKDVYRVVGDAMNKETQEVFLVIPLDLRGELKCAPYEVARGQVSRVSVDTADVLRAALHAGAEAYICAHQHPTGKATPSKADRDLTKSIKDATAVHGKSLTFVDHVVIGQKRAYSIGENKMYKIDS